MLSVYGHASETNPFIMTHFIWVSPIFGIVGKSCQELEAFYCALDDEGRAQIETKQHREARKEVERLQLVVDGKECAAKAHNDALSQSMGELTATRECVEDMCNDVASEAIATRDHIGDRFLATTKGYGWLPTLGEGCRQQERRALWRDVATQNELRETEEEVCRLKNADGIANEALQTAKRKLHEAEVSYGKADGIHVQAYKAVLAHLSRKPPILACLHRQVPQAPLHATHSCSNK